MDNNLVFQKTEQTIMVKKIYTRGFARSQRFVQISPLKAKFKVSFLNLIMATPFCLAGVFAIISFLKGLFKGELFLSSNQIIPSVSGSVLPTPKHIEYVTQIVNYFEIVKPFLFSFMGIIIGYLGYLMFIGVRDTVIFDKEKNYFYVQRKQTGSIFRRTKKLPEHRGFVSNIHALQILKGPSKQISSRTKGFGTFYSTYTHYELNLVLEDGSRINIADNGDYQGIQITATQVAKFLAIPIWDQTSGV